MHYWSNLGVVVHIFDGSKSPIDNIDKSLGNNIHYHHAPVGLLARLKLSLNFIKTDYCALCGDDEFYLPSCIDLIIKTLDTNLHLIACSGRAAGFSYKSNKLLLKNVYPEQHEYAVCQEDYYQRMLFHMRNYTPSTIYSVVKKEEWTNAMSVAVEKDYPVFAMFELQFEMMIALQGKSFVLDNLYWLRNFDIEGIRDTDISLSKNNNFASWWINSNVDDKLNNLLSDMVFSINKWNNTNDNLYMELKEAFNAYYYFDRDFYSQKKAVSRILKKFIGFNKWLPIDSYIDKNFRIVNESTIKDLINIEELLNKFNSSH
jgi:glycosyltransferase domain-containing protein